MNTEIQYDTARVSPNTSCSPVSLTPKNTLNPYYFTPVMCVFECQHKVNVARMSHCLSQLLLSNSCASLNVTSYQWTLDRRDPELSIQSPSFTGWNLAKQWPRCDIWGLNFDILSTTMGYALDLIKTDGFVHIWRWYLWITLDRQVHTFTWKVCVTFSFLNAFLTYLFKEAHLFVSPLLWSSHRVVLQRLCSFLS